jgi:hypothetical protein
MRVFDLPWLYRSAPLDYATLDLEVASRASQWLFWPQRRRRTSFVRKAATLNHEPLESTMNEDMTNLLPLALGLGGGVVLVAVIWLIFAIVRKTRGE